MKNVTLSIPDDLLKDSREYAKKTGTSLNELIRNLLRQSVHPSRKSTSQKLLELGEDIQIKKSSWKFSREEVYER